MDSQADQPVGGGTDPARASQQPGGTRPAGQGWEPSPAGEPPAGQPWGTPQPGGAQPWAGTPQPGMPAGPGQQAGGPQYGGQPPITGAMGTGPGRVRPGRIWYLGTVLLLVAGVAWVVFGFVSLTSKVDGFSRVPLPAGGNVTLNHSGGYVVYYEGAGATSGRIPGFDVRIEPVAQSAAVRNLRSYTASVTYSIGAHQGRAVLTLEVVRPGRFRVVPSGATTVPVGSDLAFGSSIAGNIVTTLLLSLGLIFLGIAATIILFIVRLTRTRRARARGY